MLRRFAARLWILTPDSASTASRIRYGEPHFTNEKMREMLASSLETAQLTTQGFLDVGQGPGSPEGNYIEWLTFKNANQAVLDDVARIKTHPLIPKTIPVHGYIYDVKTGRLAEVEGAKALGAAG